jgi:ketosteroid isomerase-like protein
VRQAFLVPVALLCTAVACSRPSNEVVDTAVAPCELSEADIASIQVMRQTDVENVRIGNWDAVASLFADDIWLMPPNAPDVRGKESLRAFMATYPALPDYSITYDEIAGCGTLAYVKGSYQFTLAVDGLDPVTDTGRFLYILRRQPNGSWLIARDMTNSDRPLPPGP